MRTRRCITTIAALVIMTFAYCMSAQKNINDTLHYNIVYKWGFIQKTAGHGHITLSAKGDTLTATLSGASIPWGGLIYQVSDTLKAVITANDGVFSETVLYQNGYYSKPAVGTTADFNNPADYISICGQGALKGVDASTIEAVTITSDMLGYFYLMRLIDFPRLQSGTTITVPIQMPSGPDRKLIVDYNGTTTYQGLTMYQTVFNYTYDGQMSSYPVTCLVDPQRRIPVTVAAQLLVGHMEMVLAE